MLDFAAQRDTMVASQLRPNRVTATDVLRTFSQTPRELYLPEALKPLAYMDDNLALDPAFAGARHRYILSPMTQAWLVQAARVTASDAVLDVACSTGYSSGILAALAGKVEALEDNAALADFAAQAFNTQQIADITIHRGPLTGEGLKAGAYNVILVNGATPNPPGPLFELLADNGRLACIVGQTSGGHLYVFEKVKTGIRSRVIWDANAPMLREFVEKPVFNF